MIEDDLNSGCEQARPYYYDYLYEETKVNIPAEIAEHIEICEHCLGEVERLGSILSEPLREAAGGEGDPIALADNANLHFSYIGASVTCSEVRPFLPSLADPLLAIKIPTPITVHLDKCEQCERDLQAITDLGLTHKQLCRFGQIFAEMPVESPAVCSEFKSLIKDVTDLNFKRLSGDFLNHICICSHCRDLVFLHREKRIQKAGKGRSDDFPCEAVQAKDLFDYCFPYGLSPGTDEQAMFSSSFCSHLVSCPSCLVKMQQLHMTVSDIMERGESGIVTCYNVTETSEQGAETFEAADPLYEDWPIKVEVFEHAEAAGLSHTGSLEGKKGERRRRSALSCNVKPIIKYASAAAAVIVLALIFINAPAARAVNLGQIYNALDNVTNMYSIVFDKRASETVQEMWISRDLNVKIYKSRSQMILWDLDNRIQRKADLDLGLVETIPIESGVISRVEATMTAPLGLLPFEDTTSLPKGAEWQHVSGEEAGVLVSDTEVYDLMWSDESLAGPDIFRKYRVYLDPATKLPSKTEFFEKREQEDEFELLTTTTVSYPSTDEIQAAITQYGLE